MSAKGCDSWSSETVARLSWSSPRAGPSPPHSVIDNEHKLKEFLSDDSSLPAKSFDLLQMTRHIRSRVRVLLRLRAISDNCRGSSNHAASVGNAHAPDGIDTRRSARAFKRMTLSLLRSDECAARLKIVAKEQQLFADMIAAFVYRAHMYLNVLPVRGHKKAANDDISVTALLSHDHRTHNTVSGTPVDVYKRRFHSSLDAHKKTHLFSSAAPRRHCRSDEKEDSAHVGGGTMQINHVRSTPSYVTLRSPLPAAPRGGDRHCIRAPSINELYTQNSTHDRSTVYSKSDDDSNSILSQLASPSSYDSSACIKSASSSPERSSEGCSSYGDTDMDRQYTTTVEMDAESFPEKEIELERRIMRQRCLIIEEQRLNFM